MENKTVEMVVKDLLLADNRKKKEEEEAPKDAHLCNRVRCVIAVQCHPRSSLAPIERVYATSY